MAERTQKNRILRREVRTRQLLYNAWDDDDITMVTRIDFGEEDFKTKVAVVSSSPSIIIIEWWIFLTTKPSLPDKTICC